MKIINIILLACLSNFVLADQIVIPHEFTAGTPALAQEVNDNFSSLVTESNLQDLRIEALEMLTGPTITDQLFCVGSSSWITGASGDPEPRIPCRKASDPTVTINFKFKQVVDAGWVAISAGGNSAIFIFNELTW